MPDNYFANYLPLLIHFILAGLLATALVTLSWLIGYRRPTRAKLSPYECGMAPIGDARERFSVKFYMVAMLFILFDVEAVFLYPWAIILKDLKRMGQGLFGLSEMFVYIGIVLVGYWYIWKKGALDWGLTISRPQTARGTRTLVSGGPPPGHDPDLVEAVTVRSEV
jgi:NADH-quinone oxidoreductase subunit A